MTKESLLLFLTGRVIQDRTSLKASHFTGLMIKKDSISTFLRESTLLDSKTISKGWVYVFWKCMFQIAEFSISNCIPSGKVDQSQKFPKCNRKYYEPSIFERRPWNLIMFWYTSSHLPIASSDRNKIGAASRFEDVYTLDREQETKDHRRSSLLDWWAGSDVLRVFPAHAVFWKYKLIFSTSYISKLFLRQIWID